MHGVCIIECGCTFSPNDLPFIQQLCTQCPICGAPFDETPSIQTDASPTRNLRHRTPVQLNPYAVEKKTHKQKLGKSTKPRRSSKKEKKSEKKREDLEHSSHDAVMDLIDEYAGDVESNGATTSEAHDAEIDIIDCYSNNGDINEEIRGCKKGQSSEIVKTDLYDDTNLTVQDLEAAQLLAEMRYHDDVRVSAAGVEDSKTVFENGGSVGINASGSSSSCLSSLGSEYSFV